MVDSPLPATARKGLRALPRHKSDANVISNMHSFEITLASLFVDWSTAGCSRYFGEIGQDFGEHTLVALAFKHGVYPDAMVAVLVAQVVNHQDEFRDASH